MSKTSPKILITLRNRDTQTSLQKLTGLSHVGGKWQGLSLTLGPLGFKVLSLCTTYVFHYMDQPAPPFFNKSPTLQGILRLKSDRVGCIERGAWATGLPLLCFLSLSSQIHSIQLELSGNQRFPFLGNNLGPPVGSGRMFPLLLQLTENVLPILAILVPKNFPNICSSMSWCFNHIVVSYKA